MVTPLISIGMPVYNGEKTIVKAIESILGQSFTDIELIISDNASTDKTPDICKKYAAQDSRVRYVRQRANVGAASNFRYVLNEAGTKYFMWASSDDVRSSDFLEVNYTFLINNPDYVASTSPVRFDRGEFDIIAMGDSSLSGNLSERMYSFFKSWHANGRYYSLMSTDLLKNSIYLNMDFFGSDWAVMLEMILAGKTNRADLGYVILGRDGFSNSGKIFKHYRCRFIHWLIPFFELMIASFILTKKITLKYRFLIIMKLIVLNFNALKAMAVIEYNEFKNK